MATATFNGVVLAEADEVISIEGVAYFPPESVRLDCLEETATRTGCPWRGIATYYTVRVGDRAEIDAAWRYLAPKRKARRIAGWVAFWKGVTVEGVEDGPRE
jgi:uncharacterized protein (DUF427 family)